MTFRFNTPHVILRMFKPVVIGYTILAFIVNFFAATNQVGLNNGFFEITIILIILSIVIIFVCCLYILTLKCTFNKDKVQFSSWFKTYTISTDETYEILLDFDDTYYHYTPNFPLIDYAPATPVYVILKKNDSSITGNISAKNPASNDYIAIEYREKIEPYLASFYNDWTRKKQKQVIE